MTEIYLDISRLQLKVQVHQNIERKDHDAVFALFLKIFV